MFDLEPTTEEYHRFFLRETYRIAHTLSQDPFTKVGAMFVRQFPHGRRAVAYCANQVSRKIDDDVLEVVIDRKRKYEHMTHAEIGAIEIGRLAQEDLTGTTCYSQWAPCDPCKEKLVATRIAEFVCHQKFVEKTPERWREQLERTIQSMKSEGIRCLAYQGDIGNVVATFNGEVWIP
jgi:deoxycytidylate deaminase